MLTLRAPEPDDLDFIFALESADSCGEGAFASAPLSRHQLWEYLQNYDADIFAAKQLRLVAVDDSTGADVGVVDLFDFDPRNRRAFVGIAIATTCRARGYGKAALDALCTYAATTLGMHQLVAVVAEDNTASRNLFAGAGFKGAGRLRSWVRRGNQYADAIIFQRLFS